jgi:hypothetical protein
MKKPPSALPSLLLPMVDPDTGLVTEGWSAFFTNMTSPATPFESIDVEVSPFTLTAIHAGSALIIGGTVSSVGLRRRRVIISPVGPVAGFFPMSQNDELIITYTALPVLWFLPNGNPS